MPVMYGSVARLQKVGLITAVDRPWQSGRNPRLYHPTDLGVALVASTARAQPAAFATQHHLWGRDLKRALAGLPQLVSLYELLADVVDASEEYEDVLAWQPPFPRLVPSSTGKSSVSVRIPAYVRLGCSKREISWFLLADVGNLPFDYLEVVLRGVATLARRWAGQLPRLLVRTTHEARRKRWNDMLNQLARQPGGAQLLRAHITCDGPLLPAEGDYRPPTEAAGSPESETISSVRHRSKGVPSTASAPTQAQLAVLSDRAADLEPAELRVLDLVARQPFLTTYEVGLFGQLTTAEARSHLRRLFAKGLVEKVARGVTPAGCGTLYEATSDGLRLAAARLGLSLRSAVRFCHLAGGGARNPMGARTGLVQTLAHARGVNATMAEFIATTAVTSRISGDGLIHWQTEAEVSSSEFRPDGYGVYRLDGWPRGFFLEFDRGTENRRDYREKLEAYYRYRRVAEQVDLYVGGFPALLFVTADEEAESRFADTARALARERRPLTIWLTTQGRIHAEDNRFGVIGRIWRQPEDGVGDRRRWPADAVRSQRRSA
jgi:DNA-binding CsgD family transcriptional regulator